MRLSRKILYDRNTLKLELLNTPVNKLPIRIKGSLLGRCIDEVMEEMGDFGVRFKVNFYLSDCYGCVEGTRNIGLGFWDADELLREINLKKYGVLHGKDELKLLIKHEIGHAFCYVNKLYRLKEFRSMFKVRGHFFRTYPEHDRYRPNPWSRDYVNPVGDHYAQKHPDDDFAETFATYIDRSREWKSRYRHKKGALRKIYAVRHLVKLYGRNGHRRENEENLLHMPVSGMRQTVGHILGVSTRSYVRKANGFIDRELVKLLGKYRRRSCSEPAHELLKKHRKFIQPMVTEQLNLRNEGIASNVISKTIARLRTLELRYSVEHEEKVLASLASFILLKAHSIHQFGKLSPPAA